MPQRIYPVCNLQLHSAKRPFVQAHSGFGRHACIADLYKRGKLSLSPPAGVEWASLIRGATMPGGMLVEAGDLNAFIARPQLDISQRIGFGHFTASGGTWTTMSDMGLGDEIRLYQYDGTPNVLTGMCSNFSLPANPMFAVSLYRAHVAPNHDWSQPPYTEVHFGSITDGTGAVSEWAVAIPYGAPMLLLRCTDGQWQKVSDADDGINMPVYEGMARGERVFIWFAVIRGHLVISTDGFVSNIWKYPLAPGEIIRSGRVMLWHNAGQWAFSFYPIAMSGCVVQSPGFETGYDTSSSTSALTLTYRHLPVVNDDGSPLHEVSVIDNTAVLPDLPVTQRAWQATVTPYVFTQTAVGTDPFTGDPVDFQTAVSPELYSVQIGEYAGIISQTTNPPEDISERVIAVTGHHDRACASTRYRVILDNNDGALGAGTLAMAEYRKAAIAIGWHESGVPDALNLTHTGYIVEPQLEISACTESTVTVDILDPMLRLNDELADGRVPVFDGWPVKDVFTWVLARCGLHESEYDLEDTGVTLSQGDPEAPLWRAEPGRSWLEFLKQVAAFDHNAAIFFGPDGCFVKACPHCRQKRTAEDVLLHDGTGEGACNCAVQWEMYTQDTPVSDGVQPGEILHLSRLRESLSSTDHRNYVMVSGIDEQGGEVQSAAYDSSSLFDETSARYVGWRKMEVYEIKGVATQAAANQRASELLQYLSPAPERISIVTPLAPAFQIGHVLRINGAQKAGIDGAQYRICEIEHKVRKAEHRIAYSVLGAEALP